MLFHKLKGPVLTHLLGVAESRLDWSLDQSDSGAF
jgi:hypothetical protein